MTETVFVDTSALYAMLDADDANHAVAAVAWRELLDGIEGGELAGLLHGSVVVEIAALVQRRLGMGALRVLIDDVLPILTTVWVDADVHVRASTALLAAGRRDVSLTDWTSFAVMRDRLVERAFAFDEDFTHQGSTPFGG